MDCRQKILREIRNLWNWLYCRSVAQLCPTLCDPMDWSTPELPVHRSLLEVTQFMSIELVMPSNHLILCRPLLLLPLIFPSIRVFSSESALWIRWPKYWSFSFSISPSNEYSGLISFRIDWFDLLSVQGTLKSLLQHHSLKASVLWCSAFSIVQGKGTTEQLYGALRTTLKDTDKFKVSGCRQHETLIVSIWRLKCLH